MANSAADYAKASSEEVSENRAPGEDKFWNTFEEKQYIKQNRIFIIKLLQGALCGLAYMPDKERLHQSLGPASIAFKFSNLEKSPSGLSEGLWRRARSAGAFTPMKKRSFGTVDDMSKLTIDL